MSNIEAMHTEHLNWFQQLDFYQDEVRFFQNRLLQLVLRRIKTLNMEVVADFRRQFIEMLRTLDDYRHHIAAHEAELSIALQSENVGGHDHSDMQTKMEILAETFGAMRLKFHQLQSTHP